MMRNVLDSVISYMNCLRFDGEYDAFALSDFNFMSLFHLFNSVLWMFLISHILDLGRDMQMYYATYCTAKKYLRNFDITSFSQGAE